MLAADPPPLLVCGLTGIWLDAPDDDAENQQAAGVSGYNSPLSSMGSIMEAEQLNALTNLLADLRVRSAELRRYL